MKVIAFSLWGNDPMFCAGAVRNVQEAQKWYPEWLCRFYIDKTVPSDVINFLIQMGCEISYMPANKDYSGLFWRMIPLVIKGCERFIVRDCDALIGQREAAAVKEWENSGKAFHIMRDHHNHFHKIMGGMWGAKGNLIPKLERDIRRRILNPQKFNNDQVYLRDEVWPIIKDNCLAHDNRQAVTGDEKFFTIPMKTNYDFVGNKYAADGTPVYTEDSR